MLVKVSQADLAKCLQVGLRGVSNQTTLPILAGLYVRAEEEKLTVQATDLEVSIACSCPAAVSEPGALVVPGKVFADIVRQIPEGAIELKLVAGDEQTLQITAQDGSFRLRTLPVSDFPRFPEVQAKQSMEIEADSVAEMISQTIKAVSRDETRPVLTGALFAVGDTEARMVATDSYRLAVKATKKAGRKKIDIQVVIPLHALDELQKALNGASGKVSICTDGNQISFSIPGVTIVSRLIEGQFPNYQQLIPESHNVRLEVGREELIGALARVSVLAQKTLSVNLRVTGKAIHISSATQGVGEAEEQVKVKNNAKDDQEIAFNAQYLLEGLQSSSGDKVFLDLTSPVSPALIRPVNEDDYMYLVMPIRVSQ